MVIGSISFTSTRQTPINHLNSNSFHNNDLVNQANSSVASASQKAASQVPVASERSFNLDYLASTYVDALTGKLYAAGYNGNGKLGLGFDEKGNGIIAAQQSFTPLFKSGDKSQPFINPIDWSLGSSSAVIDADGKLWTTGYQGYGALGNGVISTENQYTFEMVQINGSYDYKAVKVVYTGYGYSTIVMLDNGHIYGAGRSDVFGLSNTGGVNTDGTPGGQYYLTFTKLNDAMNEAGMESSKIVDFGTTWYNAWYLLDDGTLWTCNSSGFKKAIDEDIVYFHANTEQIMSINSKGDVYWGTTKILSKIDDTLPSYEGTIKGVYVPGHNNAKSWSYLTTDGDVYYCNTNGYTEGTSTFTKIATDVVHFDMSGYTNPTFGAITKDGQFKLWGADFLGMLGNGDNSGDTPGWDYNNPSIDPFYSEEALVTTPTTDGTVVTPPAVDEDGNLDLDDDGNKKPIDVTLQSPAPA